MVKRKALLIDISMCVGCGECYNACKDQNKLPKTSDDFLKDSLSDKTYTSLEQRGDYYIRKLCHHCDEPTCVSVCPVGAFEKKESGPVVYDEKKCIGCRYCMQACPFQVPRYEWGSLNPRVQKCVMCYTLVEQGLPTACSAACPTGATKFGERDELIQEAFQRIKDNPDQYYPYIYGDDEVGGTSVLFISPVPFEELKFRANIPKQPLPDFTWAALEKIPSVVVVGAVALSGFYWLTNRKNEIAREKSVTKKEGEKNEE